MAYSTIRKGSSGTDVETWQNYLKGQGYNINVSGTFDDETDKYTREYQSSNKLTSDGIVGKNTWASMNTGNNANTNVASDTNSYIKPVNGVDQAAMDKAYNSSLEISDETKEFGSKKDDALTNLTDHANKTDIVDPSIYDTLGKEMVIPEEVAKADAWLASRLEQIQSGKTSYTDQINSLMNEYLNRDKFEYDVDNDQLFQQALASAMNSGKSAMQDTIGQASALTGGYGSTYATTAGNQAYNAFIEDAYNNLPEYYQMAMQAYQMEGDEMLNQLSVLNTADANEWNKLVTGYDATAQHRNQLYNEAYTAFRDEKTDALNIANLQLTAHEVKSNDLLNVYNAYSNEFENRYAKEYQSWADDITMAQQYVNIANTDYWNQKSYNQTEYWNQKNLEYNHEQLKLEREKFEYNVMQDKWAAISGDGGSNMDLTDSEIDKIKEIYEGKGGGEAGESAVLDYLALKGITPTESDYAALEGIYSEYAEVKKGGTIEKAGPNKFKTNEGDNFDVYVGDTCYRVENYGKVTDDTTVGLLNNLKLSDKSVFAYRDQVYVKWGDDYYKVGATEILGFNTQGYNQLLGALKK